ncbi:MAG: hypothetical protein SGARI_000087 [Bacillariaceae sp.]
MSTLNYAQAANGIINKPVTTSFMTAGSSGASMAVSGDKSEGGGGGAGSVEHWHEMEVRLVDEAQQALARKHIQHQEIVERAEKAEQDRKVAEEKCQEALDQVDQLEIKVEKTTAKLQETENALSQTKVVLGATQETEAKLTQEATALLQTLQTTIAHGEAMHQDLLSRRDAQVNVKSGTKAYRKTALTIFQDTTNLLSAMGELQSNHHSILSERNLAHVADLLSHLDQHKVIIDDLQESCAEKSRELKANVDTNLLPSLQKFAAKIKKQLTSLAETTEASSESLQMSCHAITERLDQFESALTDFERSHVSETDLLTSIIAENFDDSKKSLTKIIDNFKMTMEEAASKRSSARKSLESTVNAWKTSSLASIDGIQDLSADHATALKDTSAVLTSESQCRDDISLLVKQQASVFMEKKDAYILRLEQQNVALKRQNEALKSVESEQKTRNESMVKNVMDSVQAALQKEMSDMSKFQADSFSGLSTDNQESQSSNEDLSKSIVESFDSMKCVNEELRENVSSNFAAQERVSTMLVTTSKTFSSTIEEKLQDCRGESDGFATDLITTLTACEEEDASSTKTLVEDRSHDFYQHFVNCSGPVQSNLSNHVDAVQSIVKTFGQAAKNDFVGSVRSTVDLDFMSHQRGSYAGAKSTLENLGALVTSDEANLLDTAKQNIKVAQEIEKAATQSASNLNAGVDSQRTVLQEHSASLDAVFGQFKNSFSEKISEVKSKIESSEQELDSFSLKVVQVEEAPHDVADHNVPAFSSALSSTPDASLILQDAASIDATMEKEDTQPLPPKMNVLKSRAVNVADEESASPSSSTAKRPADRSMYPSRLGKRTKS